MKKVIRAQSKPKTAAASKPAFKSNTKSGAKPYTKTNAKSNGKSYAKPEAKPDAKSYTKSNAKPYTKSNAKPDVKSNAGPYAKADAASYAKKPAERITTSSVKPIPIPQPNPKPRRVSQTSLFVDQESELLKFLIAKLPQEGRNHLKSLLARGQVSVEDKVTTLYNHPLVAGQKVVINRGKVYIRKRSVYSPFKKREPKSIRPDHPEPSL